MTIELTEVKGVIISRATSKIIGTWFVVSNKFSSVSKNLAFQRMLRDLRKSKLLLTDGTITRKASIHEVPLNYLKLTLAAGGFHLITNDAYEEFRRDSTGRTTTNPVVEPYINFDEARYFLGQKYYVARRLPSGDKTVGILWTRAGTNVFQGVIDTKLEKIISDNTGKDVSLIEPSYNSTRAIKSLPKTMSFDRMLISELNDFLAPTFYLIPSGYVEDTDMFGAFS